jgi:hypothetical protein
MKYQLSISVEFGNNPKETEVVRISNAKLFTELRRRYPDKSINPKWFTIHISYEEAKEIGLFETFRRETNKTPLAHYDYAPRTLAKHYLVQVELVPEDADVENAPWFYLICPKLTLAEFKAVEADDSYVVAKVTSKKKIAFGSTRTVGWMMLFTEGLKDKFLGSGLRGLGFKPVKLVDGSPSGLWQITSTALMPPLAMQLADGQGNSFTGDPTKACILDQGRYSPPVLRYRESDLAGVPEVDVILSAERLGFGHNAHRAHIVSQRFRQVAEKLAPGQFNYGLVAVGEGEELQTRYTIPELAPPRDAS